MRRLPTSTSPTSGKNTASSSTAASASRKTRDRFAVSVGIDNLLDRKYHAYNEQPHVAALSPAAVAAPERTYWLGFSFNF